MKYRFVAAVLVTAKLLASVPGAWGGTVDPYPVPASMVPQLLGTGALRHETRRNRGRVSGCENIFSVFVADHVYASGTLVTIDGGISLIDTGERGAWGFIKIVGSDVFTTEVQFIDRQFESDFGYFIRSNGDPFSVVNSFRCEGGGYCAVVEPMILLEMLQEFVSHGEIFGGLNRTGGETDLQFTIESDGTDWSFIDFSTCAEQLLSE